MARYTEISHFGQGLPVDPEKRRREQLRRLAQAGVQVGPAPTARPPAPAPAPAAVPQVNVSPMRRPGAQVGQAQPGQSLAVQVARRGAEDRKNLVAPAGMELAGVEVRGPGWSIKGGPTPEADLNKPARVEIPRIPVNPMRPAVTGTPPAAPPTAPEAGRTGLPEVPLTPAGAIAPPVTPRPQWQQVNPAAAAEYAAQSGGQVQVAPAPAPAGQQVQVAPAPAVQPAAYAVPEFEARQALEGTAFESEAPKLFKQAAQGDTRAQGIIAKAQEYKRQIEAGKSEKEATAAAEKAAKVQVAAAKEAKAAEVATAEGAVTQAQELVKAAQAEFEAAQKAQAKVDTAENRKSLEEKRQALNAANRAVRDGQNRLTQAKGGQVVKPQLPDKLVNPPIYSHPPVSAAQAEIQAAATAVGQPRMAEMDKELDTIMYGVAERPGMPRRPGLIPGADLAFPGVVKKDEKGNAVRDAATGETIYTEPPGAKYGKASTEVLDKGLANIKKEYTFARLGVKPSEADKATNAIFVSWLATNEDRHPEAVKAWRKAHPKLWKEYAPTATTENTPGAKLELGRGRDVMTPEAATIRQDYLRAYGYDAAKAMEAMEANGWVQGGQ